MRRLHLLRHAKSSWDEAGLADIDRPLAERGIRAAEAMAEHIASSGIAIGAVLSSPSVRTRQTLQHLGVEVEPVFIDRLYGAGASEVLATINRVADTISDLLVVGHNPAMGDLATRLAGADAEPSGIAAKYPTGALASFESPAPSWAALDSSNTTLTAFVRPRDLV